MNFPFVDSVSDFQVTAVPGESDQILIQVNPLAKDGQIILRKTSSEDVIWFGFGDKHPLVSDYHLSLTDDVFGFELGLVPGNIRVIGLGS